MMKIAQEKCPHFMTKASPSNNIPKKTSGGCPFSTSAKRWKSTDKSKCPFEELKNIAKERCPAMRVENFKAGDKCPFPQYAYKTEVQEGECPFPELVKLSEKCPVFQSKQNPLTIAKKSCPFDKMSKKWDTTMKDACPFPELAKLAVDQCPMFKAGTFTKVEGKCPFPQYAFKTEVEEGECPFPELVKLSEKCPMFQSKQNPLTMAKKSCPFDKLSKKWDTTMKDACPFPELAKLAVDQCPMFKAGTFTKVEGKCPFPQYAFKTEVEEGECPFPELVKLSEKCPMFNNLNPKKEAKICPFQQYSYFWNIIKTGSSCPYPEMAKKAAEKCPLFKSGSYKKEVGKCPFPQYAYKTEVEEGECPFPELMKMVKLCPVFAKSPEKECPYKLLAKGWNTTNTDSCPYPYLATLASDKCPLFKAGSYTKVEGKCPFPQYAYKAEVSEGECPFPELAVAMKQCPHFQKKD